MIYDWEKGLFGAKGDKLGKQKADLGRGRRQHVASQYKT